MPHADVARAEVQGLLIGVGAVALVAGAAHFLRHESPTDAPIARIVHARPPRALAGRGPRAPVAWTGVPECGAIEMAAHRTRTSGGPIDVAPNDSLGAAADPDSNTVAVLAIHEGTVSAVRQISVGAAPSQVAVGSDGRVFVTERLANRIAVYRAQDGQALCNSETPADPTGIALAPDERTVYVTSGLTHTLSAFDTRTMARRFVLDVAREPRGVAISRDGRHAFLTHIAGQPLSEVDLSTNTPRVRAVPPVPVVAEHGGSNEFIGTSLIGLPSRSGLGGEIAPSMPSVSVTPIPSQSWSLAVDDDQSQVVVAFMVNRTGREVPPQVRVDSYGAGSVSPVHAEEKTSFTLARFDWNAHRWIDVVHPQVRTTPQLALSAGALRATTTRPTPTGTGVRIPTAVALRPTDRAILVASMGTSHLATWQPVVAASAAAARRGMRIAPVPPSFSNNEAGIRTPASRIVDLADTLAAPVGLVALAGGTDIVYSQIDHAIEVRAPGRAATRVDIGHDTLPPEIVRGRRLFYTANEPRLTSGGLSCGGCHPDGRDDGLTWFLQSGPRQTPTLAGRLFAPFNWNGTQWDMAGNVGQTVRRLGGTGMRLSELDDLSAYVQRGILVPRVPTSDLAANEEHGREIFQNAGACAVCHDPTRGFTDGRAHELGGLRSDERVRTFDTPSLRFVSMTAPYFHDGRYATLRDLLTDRTHRMGGIDQLTGNDVDALESYLRTL